MRYREIAPSPAFADSIECFWSTVAEAGETTHRVSPDGCADIVLSSNGPMLVGAMTAFQDVQTGGVTVGLASTTSYLERQVASSSKLAVGDCVAAFGTADSTGAVSATSVQITPSSGGTCTTGFGGGGSTNG